MEVGGFGGFDIENVGVGHDMLDMGNVLPHVGEQFFQRATRLFSFAAY